MKVLKVVRQGDATVPAAAPATVVVAPPPPRLPPLPHLLEPDETVNETWLDLRVARRWREAADVVAIELVPFAGTLPAFTAGSCVDVVTPSGLLRSYSLCNPPQERHRYVIAVLRERRGGGSASLHDDLRAGDTLRVRGPRNEFPLAPRAVHSLLLAGGIGVTPLVSMAYSLWQRGSPFTLHYCARNPERAPFQQWLQGAAFRSSVRFHWSEQQGRADLGRLIGSAPAGAELYACGPAFFLRDAQQAFHALGRDPARWHAESF